MKIHVVSETAFMVKGNGVHTAFLDHVALLKSKNDVEVVVNGQDHGDVYHSHTYALYYFFKGLRYKKKRILTVHVIPDSIKGSLPFWPFFMPFVKWYFKQVYNFADVCIAISPKVAEAIKESGAHTEIVNIYNPINIEKWKRTADKRKEGRRLLGIPDDKFIVIGVGQLQARKGVEDFMDVAQAVPEAEFVWVGGRPFKAMTEGVGRIDSRIETATANVHFTGMVDLDLMPLYYAAADLMLFPSYQENCPLAPIEAATCGMPVVFRDIEEYRLLYKNEYSKAATTADFISITKKMIADNEFYQKGLAIASKLITQFDEDGIRQSLLGLYHRLND